METTMENAPRKEISIGEAEYPMLLSQIDKPPRTIYVLGDAAALGPGLGIVGARKATPYGIACAERFAGIAARLGITVVSGGAIGCDQAAHKGALDGGGKTVVVFGSGADVPYPKRGKQLFDRALSAGGAIVSEMAWGSSPQKWAFRNRNRIIAGLCKGILIVEAGLPSGTFSTADFALNAGRDVLVVPGSIFSGESKGSNTLLLQGAAPVIDDASFVEALGRIFAESEVRASSNGSHDGPATTDDSSAHAQGRAVPTRPLGFEIGQNRIVDMLAASPMTADQIIANHDASPLETMREISSLEARKLVVRYPDGRFGIEPSLLQV